jgi:polysaccharide export outer membrane protein
MSERGDNSKVLRVLWLGLPLLLAGCGSAFDVPRNTVDFERAGYMTSRQSMSASPEVSISQADRYAEVTRCRDIDMPLIENQFAVHPQFQTTTAPPLSPGDLVEIQIPSGELFEGRYVVAPDGSVSLPHLGPVPAAGFSVSNLEHSLSRLLIENGYFRPGFLQLDAEVLQWAPIQIHISGAVFQPGDQMLNDRNDEQVLSARLEALSDISSGRTLTTALSASAGVRPDADVRHVRLTRAGQHRIFDLSGAFTGTPYEDPILAAGDQIHVPSRQCFQLDLARPSRITAPGIRIFISNLTRPAASNAQSAIGRDAVNLPYGTRLLQGLVSANCVGGIQATNAGRWAVLISRNPMTGDSEVIARSVEGLVRRADRDLYNPVLLPGDSIACYDSHVTNLRDVLSVFSELVFPATNLLILQDAAR